MTPETAQTRFQILLSQYTQGGDSVGEIRKTVEATITELRSECEQNPGEDIETDLVINIIIAALLNPRMSSSFT